MPETTLTAVLPAERLLRHRARVAAIRERAEKLLAGGATGIQAAAAITEATDACVLELLEEALGPLDESHRRIVEQHSAVAAVGGSGRGDMAPYSDVDLLFLYESPSRSLFAECTGQVVRDCWDAGLKLGHSVRTVGDALSMARAEPEFATALVETRHLWGNPQIVKRLKRRFYRSVAAGRRRLFIDECICARHGERAQHGLTVGELEPDLKCSYGGLRDIHLIRWIGFAWHGTGDLEALRRKGALGKDDFRVLLAAAEFLTRLRIEMHLAAGKPSDILTRETQLRVTAQREIEPALGQRPVERFMQTYFRHSTAIADVADRFVGRHRPAPLGRRVLKALFSHRVNGIYTVSGETIDVSPRHRDRVCRSLESMLGFWRTAALYGVRPTSGLKEHCKRVAGAENTQPHGDPSEAARIFLDILRRPGNLGTTLRGMYETGLLERVLPEMSHARCLLQFNQYHSYTVDEHTLRAVEVAERLSQQSGPVATAYNAIKHKEILHLAIVLHDLGKGYEEDHSDVGRRLAENVAARFQLPEHQRDQLVFLVHKHLLMTHLAFRRDLSETEAIVQFSREVGTPDTLRMLYVLSACDLAAVGPGVWTDWKAELLADLFDRSMLTLSGKHYNFQEERRLAAVREQVHGNIARLLVTIPGAADREWYDRQLDALSPQYLIATPPARIAADLQLIRRLQPGDIVVAGERDRETGTVDFRVVAHQQLAEGCFHKLAGVLTAKRLEILSAQICTTLEGTVVDSVRVVDRDYIEEVPQSRIDEIAEAIRKVLTGQTTVQSLFQRHRRFGAKQQPVAVSDLPTRVVIDNESSDRCTIIDVFAHDRRGLLYTISRTLFDLGLSVVLAKISTHLDQVVDVFYVTDADGRKIDDGSRLAAIRRELEAQMGAFEAEGCLAFVS